MSTVTSKGQITIPKHIRETLGLRPGAEVEFVVENGQVILRRRVSSEKLQRWIGFLRSETSFTPDELIEQLRGEVDTETAQDTAV